VDQEGYSQTAHILDLAAQRRLEKQVVDVELEKVLSVIFCLDAGVGEAEEGFYGLPAPAVEAIVEVGQITYVPGVPAWIPGVVNVRGEIESALDLKAVLGLGRTEIGPESRLLIAQEGELRSGLLVDRVVDIVGLPAKTIAPPPVPLEGGKGHYISGEAEYAGRPLLLLDLAEIFRRALAVEGA
jgi:purine-binding chemotaxis protein CheW